MDNWNVNDSDSMVANLEYVSNAEGSLQEQADIYAESWEAAQKRVQSSVEAIYSALINDEFFIDITNVFADFLDIVKNLITGLGGVQGVLSVISSYIIQMARSNISKTVSQTMSAIKNRANPNEQTESALKVKTEANTALGNMMSKSNLEEDKSIAQTYQNIANIQGKMVEKARLLTDSDKAVLELQMQQYESIRQQVTERAKEVDNAKKLYDTEKARLDLQSQKVQNEYNERNNKIDNYKSKTQFSTEEYNDIKGMAKEYGLMSMLPSKKQTKKVKDQDGKEYYEFTKKSLDKILALLDKIQEKNNQAFSMKNASAELDKLQNKLKAINNIIYNNSKNKEDYDLTGLKDALDGIDYQKVFGDGITDFDELQRQIQEGELCLENFKEALQEVGIQLGATFDSEYSTNVGNLAVGFQEAQYEMERTGEASKSMDEIMNATLDNVREKGYTTSDAIAAVGQQVMSVVSVLSQIRGMIDIFNDEDLSDGERFLALLTSIGTILPTLINAFSSETTVKLASYMASKLASGGLLSVGTSAAAAGAGTTVAAAGLTKLQIALLGAIGPAGLVVAALGALLLIFKQYKDQHPETQLKHTTEALASMEEVISETETEASNLKNTLDSYDSAVKTLNNCTRGTQEWKEALQQANDAALTMIDSVHGLSADEIKQLYSRNESGLIELDQEKIKEYQLSLNQTLSSANYAKDILKYQQVSDQNDVIIHDMVYGQEFAQETNIGMLETSRIEHVIKNRFLDLADSTDIDEFKDKLGEINYELVSITGLSDETLQSWFSSIQSMAENAEEAAEKLELVSQIQADEILGDNYSAEEKNFAAKATTAYEKQQIENYLGLLTDGKQGSKNHGFVDDNGEKISGISVNSQSTNEVYQYVLKKLQKAGYDVSAQGDNAVRGNDNNRILAFLDSSGKEVTFNAEQISSMLAAADAIEEMGENAKKARELFLQFSDSEIDTATTIVNNFNQDEKSFDLNPLAAGLSSEQLSKLSSGEYTQEEAASILGLSSDQLTTIFETLKTDWAQFCNDLTQSAVATEEELNKVGSNLKGVASGFFNNIQFGSSSLEEKKALENTISQIFKNFGNQGIINLSKLIDWQDSAQVESFAKALQDIDWTQDGALDEFKERLIKAKIAVDEVNLINFVEQMQEVNKEASNTSLSQVQSQFKEINDAIKGLSWGDSIDPDVYNNLSENSKNYFTLMADGTYKLTGDAKKFYALVMSEQRTNFENAYNESTDKIQGYETQKSQVDQFLTDSGLSLEELGKVQNLSKWGQWFGTADKLGVENQLKALQAMGYADKGQMDIWQGQLTSGVFSEEDLQAIASAVQESTAAYYGLTEEITAERQKQQDALSGALSTMTSVEELEKYLNSDSNSFSLDNLNEGLLALGLNLGITEEAWTEFFNKVQNGTVTEADTLNMKVLLQEQQILELEIDTLGDLEKARRNNKISANEEGTAYEQLAKKTTKGQEALYEYKQALLDCEEGSNEAIKALNNFKKAIEQIEVNEAAQNIYDLMEELKDVPEQDLDLSKYNDDLEGIATQLKNIFGQDFKYDAAFVKKQWDLISQYLTGTEEEQYQAALALTAMGQTNTNNLVDAVTQAFESVGLESETCKAEILAVVNILQNADFNADGTLSIDTVQAIANVGALQTQAEKTAGILNSILGTDITLDVDGIAELNNALADLMNNGPGIDRGKSSWTDYAKKVTIKARGTAPNYVIPDGITTVGGGSGGGSSNGTMDTVDLDDVIDRYKEIDDAIDDMTRATERASKAADRLYGKSRINQMKAANDMLQQEIGLLKQKQAQAQSYLSTDRAALNAAAAAVGASLSIDGNGNISNYTSQMESLYNQLNSMITAANADGEVSDEEKKNIDEYQKRIDSLKDAISQYDETKELIQDLEDQITDKFYEWQDNNYEILHYELEIEIELNDLQLEYIDYYLNKIEDDFYAMAEAVQYMTNQIPLMTDSLGDYENFYNKITAAYEAGEICQADYVEGMKEAYSSILDQLQALNELDKEMMHYYEDTLDAALEELSKYTDHLEHLTNVLGHYKNLVELINGEYDYESIGKILDGQAKTIKNELDALTANYRMLLTEKAAIEQSLANAQDDAARELFQKELDAINAAVDEAQENMLSKTEEWAEAQKAIMENAMSEAAAEMEKAFTNGMGFDALSDSLGRLNSYTDEYLTKTNQMYETQKLINTAQQAIDKTNNEAAKARLKAYTDEIEELQEKNKLSNLELEIAKAKYDVVLAEIALEEAQNAKSTVRLQRDNEGNFGYVYTSDQEQVSQAEQDLADAQNALYNIGLEGTNEYGQKLLELQQQLADSLIALEQQRADGQFATDEEYYAARDRLIQEYNDLFLAYSEQYTTAMGVDVSIQEEAWINAYENMINKTADWKDRTTEYTQLCEEAFRTWRDAVESESSVVDAILNDLEQEVKDVTKESDNLRNEIVNSVIPAINNQLISVRNVTSAYAQQRSEIQALIAYYESLAQSILATIQAQAALDGAMSSSSSSSGFGGSSSVDYSLDYSRLMSQAWDAGDMEAYNYYKQMRDQKIAAGYSDYGVSTGDIDDYLNNIGHGIDDDEWWTDILHGGGFATGGYTGNWGPEGKIAMLHEKELVLNADDTVNMLKGVKLARQLAQEIDVQALRQRFTTLPYYPGAEIQGIGNSSVEQSVRIEASFPSVTDRNEIQEAFNNLVNRAAQYANRK